MGLPETLKGVRLGGCRFTARGRERFDANLGVSTHGRMRVAQARRRPPYNLDEGGGAPARGTHTQALNSHPGRLAVPTHWGGVAPMLDPLRTGTHAVSSLCISTLRLEAHFDN